ncbi:MAG: hypothetical protein Ct9H90mP6_11130 [Gammaproteobacteria bacterium]|nr:MAG: hypothetical protein Ct9H90mP6_11130 [Gammaproteobacteria bacterium]
MFLINKLVDFINLGAIVNKNLREKRFKISSWQIKYFTKAFDFIDLFAGIGGFRKGFESIGGNCVFTSEIDRFAQETYKANFQTNHFFAGDIREVI